jgi:hypothetical protein
VRQALATGGMAALASKGPGGAGAKLSAAQMRDPEAVLATLRLGEDQGWTLARTAELV